MTTDKQMKRLYLVTKGRSTIQYVAHDLLGLMDRHRAVRSAGSLAQNRYEALVAVTFSLWRAIFLADDAAGWEAVLTDAEVFLHKLIKDNSINYSDDWNNRNWSFVYYLNNARFRLSELVRTWPEFRERLGDTAEWLESPVVGYDPIALWEQHCTAVQSAIWTLTRPSPNEMQNGKHASVLPVLTASNYSGLINAGLRERRACAHRAQRALVRKPASTPSTP